jgi:hypothetical protein
MEKVDFIVGEDLEPYINLVMVKEDNDPGAHANMPFYADGYPGIMFQQSENGFFILPRNKKLSELYLYGQTLDPISLDVKGPHRFVVFQLYPFASKYLLGVDPRELNDDCYDLLQLEHVEVAGYYRALVNSRDFDEQIRIISDLMRQLIALNQVPEDDRIQQAIEIVLQHKGQVSVKELREQLFLTERTFERKFMAQVGLTPKQMGN